MKVHKSIYRKTRYDNDSGKCGVYRYPIQDEYVVRLKLYKPSDPMKLTKLWKEVTCKHCLKHKR